MKVTIDVLLRRLGMDRSRYIIVSFDGVGNMENDLPAQLFAMRGKGHSFLILRDNDNGNCVQRKRCLNQTVSTDGEPRVTKVRIVCQMLEAWFLGDSEALTASKHFTRAIPKRLRDCDPDQQKDPKRELRKLREGYNPISGAKAIVPHLVFEKNRSSSFKATISALRELM